MSAVLDAAEAALVSCRFAEASSLCREHLEATLHPDGNGTSTPVSSSSTSLHLGDLSVAVADLQECDQLIAVLLQCGFELGRKNEYRFCHSYYKSRALKHPIPLAIALLWLKLRLEEGELEFTRQALQDMRTALRDDPSGTHSYAQISEMLVADVLLPAGDFAAAKHVLSESTVSAHMEPELLTAMLHAAYAAADTAKGNGHGANHGTSAIDTSSSRGPPGRLLQQDLDTADPFGARWETKLLLCAAAVAGAVAAYRGRGALARVGRGATSAATHTLRFILGEEG